jgi:hypothetical protein
MAYAFLTDGYRVIGYKEVTSQAELDSLNENVSETAGPDFKWILESLKPQEPDMGKLMPKPIVNRAPYNADARAGTTFEHGEDWIAEDDDFATFVINQREPCHNCKILVFGDEHMRELISDFLNKLHRTEETPADGTNQAG